MPGPGPPSDEVVRLHPWEDTRERGDVSAVARLPGIGPTVVANV